MMKIPYFVFTNGEEGENMMDWGVKHSSASLGDRRTLDAEYQALLSAFGMSPSLEIPDDGKVNVLLLPWMNRRILLGYVFPSTDHKGRKNTSSVLCVLQGNFLDESVRETARRIWSSNDLRKIAKRGGERPESLELNEKAKTEGVYPFVVREWPSQDAGYFSSGNNLRRLNRVEDKGEIDSPPPKPCTKYIVAGIVLIVVIAGAYWYSVANARRTRESMIAAELQAQQERDRQEAKRRADEEARYKAERDDEELSRLENKIREAEENITDALNILRQVRSDITSATNADNIRRFVYTLSEAETKANTAKFLASSINDSRLDAEARGLIVRADEILRESESLRTSAEHKAQEFEKAAADEQSKRKVKNVIVSLNDIPELKGFSCERVDSYDSLPKSDNVIDTPFGRMTLCKLNDDYVLVNKDRLKKLLMSFCDGVPSSRQPDDNFMLDFKRTNDEWKSKVLDAESSEAFIDIRSMKPEQVSGPVNLEEYLTQALSNTRQRNFRLFYKGSDDAYIVVYVNAEAPRPEKYIAARDAVLVDKSAFLTRLREKVRVDDGFGRILFGLMHKDERLKDYDIDGKFELFIDQLVNSGGAQ